jgi:hypothetical protein
MQRVIYIYRDTPTHTLERVKTKKISYINSIFIFTKTKPHNFNKND